MTKRPPAESTATPMAESNSASFFGGIWLWPPNAETVSSHSSRVYYLSQSNCHCSGSLNIPVSLMPSMALSVSGA